MDGRNIRALAILGLWSQARAAWLLSDDPKAELRRADDLTARALALDPNNYLAHYARAYFLAYQRPDEAIAKAERALALNPSFLPSYIGLWAANWTAGRPKKAIDYAETGLRLGPRDNPRDPLAYAFLREKGMGLFSLLRYEEAAEAVKESVAANPEVAPAYLWLTASYAFAGRDAEARETLQRYLALPSGARSIAQVKRRQPFESPFLLEVYDRVYQGLRKAGMPEE